MIRIKFGILLAVSLLSSPDAEDRKQKKGSKEDDSTNSGKKEHDEKPKYVYEVGKPEGYFHIEYVLLPDGPPYMIDVVYWENISKVFTDDGVVIYRHYIIDDRIWIPVMLEHEFDDMTIEELVTLHSYAFEVVIAQNKNKLGKNANSENTKVFYTNEEDVGKENIVEAFDTNPNVELNETQLSFSAQNVKPINVKKKEFKSKIFVFENSIIFPRMKKIIKQVSQGKEIFAKEYIPNAPDPIPAVYEEYDDNDVEHITWISQKKNKGAKGKKEDFKRKSIQNKEMKNGTNCVIKISGETFFTDPNLSVYGSKEKNNTLDQAYVLLSTYNLMKKAQRTQLNPFVIKLKTVNSLPIECMEKQGFTSLYLEYNIPYVGRTSTQPKSLSKRIKFNEAHAYFYVPCDTLLQFLQTQRLRVELVGVRENDELQPHVFSTAHGDCACPCVDTKKYFNEKPTVMVLAAACFDLSMLQNPVNKLQLVCPFRHPDNILVQKATDMYENVRFTKPVTINDINFSVVLKSPFRSTLDDYILLSHGTCLKIEACISEPFCPMSDPKLIPEAFKRMLLIVYQEGVASVILNEILLNNQTINSKVLLPSFIPQGIDSSIDPKNKILTGFVIDNGSSFIFFLESTTINATFDTIWSQVRNMNRPINRVFYNSEHTFPKRIYETYRSIGGMIKTSLKVPLQDIFQIPHAYLNGNVPRPALQAILKLELLLRAQTMMEINQYCLYPTASELISFIAEFGVPYRF